MAAVNDTRRAGKSLQQNQEARVRLCSRVGSTPCCPSLTGPGWPSASARECVSSSPGSRGPSPIGPRSAYVQAEQTAACEAEIYFPYVSPPPPPLLPNSQNLGKQVGSSSLLGEILRSAPRGVSELKGSELFRKCRAPWQT